MELNYLAILAATAISFGLGGLWYSPALFGKAWMRETGITEESARHRNMAKIFALAILATLIMAFITHMETSYHSESQVTRIVEVGTSRSRWTTGK